MDSVNYKENFQERVYYQVIEYIKLLVKEGKLEFGRKLPSEREMMERLGLSRNSIREALRTMEHMGLIESRQGKGNFLVNHMGRSLGSVFSMLIFMKESNYLEVSQLRRAMEAQAFDLTVGNLKEKEKEKKDTDTPQKTPRGTQRQESRFPGEFGPFPFARRYRQNKSRNPADKKSAIHC